MKHHHPHNRRERMQLEAARKKKFVKKEGSQYGRHAAELLEEKEAEDAVRNEVCREVQ